MYNTNNKPIRNLRVRDIKLERKWTKIFMDELWSNPEIFSKRNIVYIYQDENSNSCAGKSTFCNWLEQEKGETGKDIDGDRFIINDKVHVVNDYVDNRYPVFECPYVKDINRESFDTDASFRYLIYDAYSNIDERNRLFSGNTLLIDLCYSQELDPVILQTLELFKDGTLINSIPTLSIIRMRQPNRVIVFGRQKPNVGWWEKCGCLSGNGHRGGPS